MVDGIKDIVGMRLPDNTGFLLATSASVQIRCNSQNKKTGEVLFSDGSDRRLHQQGLLN